MSTIDGAAIAAKLERRWAAPIPPSAVERAKLLVADFVGAVLAGSAEPEQAALREKLLPRAGNTRCCTVFGDTAKADAETAAFLNASAGTAGELDDLLPEARTHPGTHVIPVALSLCEADGISGSEFVRAVVQGYEASALLADAFHERPAWIHPHAYLTAAAAAVAGAAARRLDADALAELINCAVIFAPRLPFAAAWEGATVRNAYAGFGAMVAMRSLDCIEVGLTAPAAAIQFVRERVGIAGERPPGIEDATYAVERAAIKFLPVCASLHPVLYAVRELRDRVEIGRVAQVEVTGSAHLANFMSPQPPNTLARRFNLRFSLAEEILHGLEPGKAFHSDDPAVDRLAANVDLVQSDERTAVSIVTEDGRRFESAAPATLPYPDRDRLADAIRDKFMTATSRRTGAARARDLWSYLMQIDQVGRIDWHDIV